MGDSGQDFLVIADTCEVNGSALVMIRPVKSQFAEENLKNTYCFLRQRCENMAHQWLPPTWNPRHSRKTSVRPLHNCSSREGQTNLVVQSGSVHKRSALCQGVESEWKDDLQPMSTRNRAEQGQIS